MPHLSAEAKHAILLEYVKYSRTHSLTSLAQRHGIVGGRPVLARWLKIWDGTPDSLRRSVGSGRHRTLTRAQVARHVQPRIAAANRNNKAIDYAKMLPSVRASSGCHISLRTLQRYGQEIGARSRRTVPRTTLECQ